MNYYYLLPIVFILLIACIRLVITNVNQKKVIKKPFLNEYSNALYSLSFVAPFKWFVNNNKEDKRVKYIENLIKQADELDRCNYRVYIAIQVILLLFSIILFSCIAILVNKSAFIIKILFNIKVNIENMGIVKNVLLFLSLSFLAILIPRLYLKHKAKLNNEKFTKQLPILQLFIILMLKAKRPLMEIFYILSTTNTIYKNIFTITYRMYLRDKDEGIDYLMKSFENTKFKDVVLILKEYDEYSKKDTLSVLENTLKDTINYVDNIKKNRNSINSVLSNLTVIVPFLTFIFIGLAPLVYWALDMLSI